MTTLSKEEYLKRYLDPVKSGDYKKKKKSREKIKRTRGMKIVDDDVSWSKLAPKDEEIPDELLMKEEMPKIEEIDERTKEEQAMDVYRKGDKWKMIDAREDAKTGSENHRTSTRHDSDSDMDVPRRTRHDSSSDPAEDTNLIKRASRHDSDSDLDIERRPRKRHDSSSSNSDRYKTAKKRDSSKQYSKSLPKEKKDLHKSKKHSAKVHKSRRDYSASSSDSDTNDKQSTSLKSGSKIRWRQDSDSDLELPRARLGKYSKRKSKESSKSNQHSDLDVPRANPVGGNKKMNSGGVGGITSREELQRELQEKRKRESDIDKLAKESQKEATVFRKKGGKKRDLEQEKLQKDAEDEEKGKKLEKYHQWGKGMTQTEMKDYALEDLIHEANKPLARYADDADLDAFQRSQMRDGDPMAEYLAKKRGKETGNMQSLPKYRGPAPAPNFYGISPGYRWDGVDRSTGFEKKFFHSHSEKGALRQEAYKWSVEDM